MKEKKNNISLIGMSGFFVGVAILSIILFVVFSKHETYVSDNEKTMSIGLLDCKSSNPNNPFFISAGASDVTHEIKITFGTDGPDKLSYNFYGTYASEALADTARSEMHADYNKYMGGNGISQESLYPTFNYNGNKVKINLYAEKSDGMNAVSAKLFFLDFDEYEQFSKYTGEDLEKIYFNKGFSCNLSK